MALFSKGSMFRPSELWDRMQQLSLLSLRRMSSSGPDPQRKLDGKVAIITGAASGIGATTAKLFASHGAHVVVADIAEENGHKIVSEIGPNAHFKLCDVSKEEDVSSTVDFAMEKFGKLDIMHNNAGFSTMMDEFHTLDMAEYDRGTSVLVRGVVMGIKHAARVMIPAKKGAILITGSVVADGVADSYPLVYNINKNNLPGLAKIAAHHLGKHGIRVNIVSPHIILTPAAFQWMEYMGYKGTYDEALQSFIGTSTLAGKSCTMNDIAHGALFLCCDDSGYISGQNLVIDGGYGFTKSFALPHSS